MAKRARSEGVVHKPAAAISGYMCHFPFKGFLLPVCPVARKIRLVVWQWLFKRALLHVERPQHALLHELRKRRAGQVDDQLLHDCVAAAGVTP